MRTTQFHDESGDLKDEVEQARRNYISSFGFVMDFIATLPVSFFGFSSNSAFKSVMQWMELVKLVKVFRLQLDDTLSNHSEAVKMTMKIVHLFFYLLFYIHFTACIQFYIISIDKEWLP